MAIQNFIFNIAKGRILEFIHRVDSNDPANSAIIVVPLSVGGTAAQGQDFDDLAAVLADANFDPQTTGGWVRKTLTDADISDFTTDDSGNVSKAALPAITWTTVSANIVGFLICYDPDTTSGTDSNIIPLTCHAIAVTGVGSNYTLNAGVFVQAG